MWSYWWKRHHDVPRAGQKFRVVGIRTEEQQQEEEQEQHDGDSSNSPLQGKEVSAQDLATGDFRDTDERRKAMRRSIDLRRVVENRANVHDLLEVTIRLVHAMIEVRRKTDGLGRKDSVTILGGRSGRQKHKS